MTDFDISELASGDRTKFRAMVKSASKSQLEAVLAGEHRAAVLDGIFSHFPNQLRADRAGSTNAVIHWTVGGRADGGSDTYEVTIANGACTVTSSPTTTTPKLALTMGGVEFLQLVSGNANPMMMFMSGKLKAKGDLGLAASLGNLFDLPKG